jgi:hypothetical protein
MTRRIADMHRCPWCGDPCDCDEIHDELDERRDCDHDCGNDELEDDDEL